jgi:alginate O-acetyltransferase complex protein AlgI
MIFASFEFLFLFLPLFFAVYYLTPPRLRNWPILILSWAFYAWWRVDFLALLVCVTAFTYAISRGMVGVGLGTRAGKRLLVLGLVGNLGVLAYFKYANFGVNVWNETVTSAGFSSVAWEDIVLPAGLSFYVLQSISYLVDVWRGTIPVSRSLLNYAAYKAMFSQLIAGPIVRYAQIADELKHRAHTLALFGLGARRFMIGFCMKVIIADTLSPLVDAIFKLPTPTLADAWLGAAAYTLQLYFDFAGYSAMAIGLALMIGFHFPENFNDPYLSGSIQAFWNRWHITLSSFLRDYLYIPLGGNRHGEVRTYVNLMLTMLIGGFWHGANWTFLVWGGWHGAMLCTHRLYRPKGSRGMPWIIGHPLTLLGVVLGWVVFRADNFGIAMRVYRGMAGLQGIGVSDDLAWQLTPDRLWTVAIGAAIVYVPLVGARAAAASGAAGRGLSLIGPFCGFLLAMVLLYSRAAVPFLYFQF